MNPQVTRLRATAGALAATLLAACASHTSGTNTAAAGSGANSAAASATAGTPAEQATLARYEAYAGPPLDSFTWLGRFDSWQGLAKDRLAVFTTPSEAYLLKVWPPCDMRFVTGGIGLTSTSRTIYARLDSVLARGGPGNQWRCPISEIRRIDYTRMRDDIRAGRLAAPAQAPAAPPPPPAQANPPQR